MFPAIGAWSSLPNRSCNINDQLELRALLRFAQRVAGRRTCEPALRTECQPVEIHISACFIEAAPQALPALQRSALAAHEPEHDTLRPRHEAQWHEVTRPRRV